jgi:hypothetical protein
MFSSVQRKCIRYAETSQDPQLLGKQDGDAGLAVMGGIRMN